MAIQRQTFRSENPPADHQGCLPYIVRLSGMPFRALTYISSQIHEAQTSWVGRPIQVVVSRVFGWKFTGGHERDWRGIKQSHYQKLMRTVAPKDLGSPRAATRLFDPDAVPTDVKNRVSKMFLAQSEKS
jgi:hypothetical protein